MKTGRTYTPFIGQSPGVVSQRCVVRHSGTEQWGRETAKALNVRRAGNQMVAGPSSSHWLQEY